MPRTQLAHALSDLQRNLEARTDLGPEDRAALVDLHMEIGRVLDQTEEVPRPEAHGQVGDAISRFEAANPKLTEVLNRIAHALSAMGV